MSKVLQGRQGYSIDRSEYRVYKIFNFQPTKLIIALYGNPYGPGVQAFLDPILGKQKPACATIAPCPLSFMKDASKEGARFASATAVSTSFPTSVLFYGSYLAVPNIINRSALCYI